MTLMQFNDLFMVVIGIGVTTLSIMAYKYYKRSPLFDECDLTNDHLNNECKKVGKLGLRDRNIEKQKARLKKRAKA